MAVPKSYFFGSFLGQNGFLTRLADQILAVGTHCAEFGWPGPKIKDFWTSKNRARVWSRPLPVYLRSVLKNLTLFKCAGLWGFPKGRCFSDLENRQFLRFSRFSKIGKTPLGKGDFRKANIAEKVGTFRNFSEKNAKKALLRIARKTYHRQRQFLKARWKWPKPSFLKPKTSENRRKWVQNQNDGELWAQIYYKATRSEPKSFRYIFRRANTLK